MDFQDAGFCDTRSTEGTLATRYMIGDMELTAVLDMLIKDAERLGISFGLSGLRPALYAKQDGEDGEEFYPTDWRNQLAREADRIGWECNYRAAA